MNQYYLVAVIMHLYYVEKYVAESIQSIIDQSYFNWVLLIVNDGSTDNSLAVAQQYQSDRIKVFIHENKWASAAGNYRLGESKGV